jgi:hypothetical protein
MFNAESNVSKHLEINVSKNEPQIGGIHIPQENNLSSRSQIK